MNDNTTLAREMVAAPGATRNVNLSTDPKRVAFINVWDAICVSPFLTNHENVI